MLSRPVGRVGLIVWIFLNSYWLKGDEAELFDRYEHRANEEVLLREKELESFKPKFTQQEAVEESILQEVSLKNQGTYVQFREIKLIGGDMLSERDLDFAMVF